jgi:lipopolysaccharide export system protein LptC
MGMLRRSFLILLCVLLGTQGHAMARHLNGHQQHHSHYQTATYTALADAVDAEDTAHNPVGKALGKCMTGAQVYHLETAAAVWSTPPAFATPRVAIPHTLALSHPVPDKPPRKST